MYSLEDNLGCTILLTCRHSRIDPQGSCEAARGMASGVIDLRLVRRGGELARTLGVRKMGGTPIDLAKHDFGLERRTGLSLTSLAEPPDVNLFRRPRRALADAVAQSSDSPEAV